MPVEEAELMLNEDYLNPVIAIDFPCICFIGFRHRRVKNSIQLLFIFMFFVFIFCYWAWFKIATSAPPSVSSLSTLMIPVVGVFSGVLVLGESPHWQEYAALVLVIAALATVLIGPRAPASA